jgi:hypothetical protein
MDERPETTRGDDSEPPAPKSPALLPAEQERADAEAIRLGRWLPLGMIAGAAAGLLAGFLTRRFGICVPVGIALGILLSGTLPVFFRGRR